MKQGLKERATMLRKEGKSYADILRSVPVAKSTLSLWLRNVGLSKRQQQTLSARKLESAKRGAYKRKENRITQTKELVTKAKNDIHALSDYELLLVGAALYQAEGSKEKEGQPGIGLLFSNSDPAMHRVVLAWYGRILHVPAGEITYELYVHQQAVERLEEIRAFWAAELNLPVNKLTRVYYKKDKKGTSRKNVGNVYYGLLRTRVSKSSTLNRRTVGWAMGIHDQVVRKFRA